MFIIKDWSGKELTAHGKFKTFDDTESYLSEFLGDDYDEDRQEYEIVKE